MPPWPSWLPRHAADSRPANDISRGPPLSKLQGIMRTRAVNGGRTRDARSRGCERATRRASRCWSGTNLSASTGAAHHHRAAGMPMRSAELASVTNRSWIAVDGALRISMRVARGARSSCTGLCPSSRNVNASPTRPFAFSFAEFARNRREHVSIESRPANVLVPWVIRSSSFLQNSPSPA